MTAVEVVQCMKCGITLYVVVQYYSWYSFIFMIIYNYHTPEQKKYILMVKLSHNIIIIIHNISENSISYLVIVVTGGSMSRWAV